MRKKRLSLWSVMIAVALLVALPDYAIGAEWVLLTENVDGSRYYYDAQGIKKKGTDNWTARMYVRYGDGGKWASIVEYDCKGSRYRYLKTVTAEENEPLQKTGVQEWGKVPADTEVGMVFECVCNKKCPSK